MKRFSFVLLASGLGLLLTAGCAGPEKKLGRGMRNMGEIVRWGEARRSVEQAALFEGPGIAYTTGAIRGFNRSMARFGIGLYEVLTSPFPPYDPVAKDFLSAQSPYPRTPEPVFPSNYKPNLIEDSNFATDVSLGFSGGDIAPFVPGSRFRVFDAP